MVKKSAISGWVQIIWTVTFLRVAFFYSFCFYIPTNHLLIRSEIFPTKEKIKSKINMLCNLYWLVNKGGIIGITQSCFIVVILTFGSTFLLLWDSTVPGMDHGFDLMQKLLHAFISAFLCCTCLGTHSVAPSVFYAIVRTTHPYQ